MPVTSSERPHLMLLALLAALLFLSPAADSARLPSITGITARWHHQLPHAAADGWAPYSETDIAPRGSHKSAAALQIWHPCLQALRAAMQTIHGALQAVTRAASQHGTGASDAGRRVMRRHFVNGTDPLAVCNDGTPGMKALGMPLSATCLLWMTRIWELSIPGLCTGCSCLSIGTELMLVVTALRLCALAPY